MTAVALPPIVSHLRMLAMPRTAAASFTSILPIARNTCSITIRFDRPGPANTDQFHAYQPISGDAMTPAAQSPHLKTP
jgi:hypothetical protein